jgi:hypothetical protein
VRGHRDTLPIHSEAYQEWLLQQFFLDKEKAPTSGAIKSAVATLAAIVKYGPDPLTHIDVQLRNATVDGRIYIDLGNEQRQCIEVDGNGWRIVGTPTSVRFRRTDGMKALPVPLAGGNINTLKEFVNLSDKDFVLFVAVLLDAFRSGKHPILNLVGEFATAKSTLAKIFKKLVDPDETELRSLPGTTRDIFIAVQNARVRAWDNVSKIEQTISDALCQLSDGSGFGTRKLYTDGDEFRVQGSRSIILTGLSNAATRPDLNSRTVMLSLHPIKDDARKSETEFWTRFNEAAPLILGALLDALVHGLKTLPTIRLDKLDRLADFQLFGHAVEGAYAPAGSFAAAFASNKTELNEAIIEDDSVAKAITVFMVKRTEWSGTTTALMIELQNHDRTEQQVTKQKDWPKDATRFSKRVHVVSAVLRKAGIEVTFDKALDRIRTRTITLRTLDAEYAADANTKSRPQRLRPQKGKAKVKGKGKKKPASAASSVRKRPSQKRK